MSEYRFDFKDIGRDKRSFSINARILGGWGEIAPEDGDMLADRVRRLGGLRSRDVSISVSKENARAGTVFAGMHPVGKWEAVELAP